MKQRTGWDEEKYDKGHSYYMKQLQEVFRNKDDEDYEGMLFRENFEQNVQALRYLSKENPKGRGDGEDIY